MLADDDGAKFTAVFTKAGANTVTSNAATLTVTAARKVVRRRAPKADAATASA